jgi:FkbM family methyltransferase
VVSDRIKRALRPIVHSCTDRRRVNEIDLHVKRLIGGMNLGENSIVLDLGANRGDFSVWASKTGAKVFAFEPHPHALEYLYKRRLKHKNIFVVPFAISNSTGIANFYNHPDSKSDPLGFSIRSSLTQKHPSFQGDVEVFKLSLQPFLEGLDHINCVKVDIEGEESKIYPLLKKYYEKIEFCLIEIHDSINPNLRSEINGFIQSNSLGGKWSTEWI